MSIKTVPQALLIYVGLAQRRAICLATLSTLRVLRPDFRKLAEEIPILSQLNSPYPAGFAYYPDIVQRDEGGVPSIWHIDLNEYVVISLTCFPLAAPYSTVGGA